MNIFCLLLSKVSQQAGGGRRVRIQNAAQELSYSGGEEFKYD